GVEANDVFADEMQVRRPHAALFEFRAVDGAEIRGERVEPYVENVGLFSRDGDAPANRGAGDAEVLQPAFHETDDLVAARLRLDESRVFAIEIEERLFECGEFEEVVFFGESFERPAAIGTVVPRL